MRRLFLLVLLVACSACAPVMDALCIGCGALVSEVVVSQKDGRLLFDVPEAKDRQHVRFTEFYVNKFEGGSGKEYYWGFSRSNKSPTYDPRQLDTLPLEYGQALLGTINEFPQKQIDPGRYVISGGLFFVDGNVLEWHSLNGSFEIGLNLELRVQSERRQG